VSSTDDPPEMLNHDEPSPSTEEQAEREKTEAVLASLAQAPADDQAASLVAKDAQEGEIPELLPVLPGRDTVIFPGTIVPLSIGRDKSKRLLENLMAGSKMLGVVAQRNAAVEDPTLNDLYRVGTVVSILKVVPLSEGNQSIIVHALVRFGIEELTQTEPFLIARAHPREDVYTESRELEALVATAKRQASRVIDLTPGVPDEAVACARSTRPSPPSSTSWNCRARSISRSRARSTSPNASTTCTSSSRPFRGSWGWPILARRSWRNSRRPSSRPRCRRPSRKRPGGRWSG